MVEKAPSLKDSTRFFLGASFGHFVNDGNFLIFPILIVYYTDLHVGLLILGVGAIIQNLVSGFMSSPIGMLADKIDRDGLLISIGLALEALSLLVFALTFTERQYGNILVLAGTCLLGFGQAFYHPIGGSVLTLIFPRGQFEKFLGLNGSIASTSRAVLPAVIGVATSTLGYANGLLAIVVYMFIAISFIYFALSTFRRSNYRRESRQEQIPSKGRRKLGKYRGFLVLLTTLAFIRAMFTVSITTFLPDYVASYIGSGFLLYEFLTIMFIPTIVGQPFMGTLIAKKGGKFTVSLTTILAMVFFAVFMSTHLLVIMLASAASFAFVIFSGFPIFMGYVGQEIPSEIITTANSLVWGLGSTIGGAVGVAVITVLLLSVPFSTAFWIMLIFGLIAAVLIAGLPPQTKEDADPVTTSSS